MIFLYDLYIILNWLFKIKKFLLPIRFRTEEILYIEEKETIMEFYVYVYLDTRKPGIYVYGDLVFDYEPIYVGKGKKRRYKNHMTLRNYIENHFYHKLNKMIAEGFYPEIILVKDKLDEKQAFEIEIDMIKQIGRNINNGTLLNLTDGGEGSSGRICSQETKIKISGTKLGSKNGMFGKIHPMKGKSFDEFFGIERANEIKKLVVENNVHYWKDKTLTKETKDKISKTLKRRFENKENHPAFGKKIAAESKKKISETLIKYFENNPKVTSEETKQKQSLSASGSNNSSFTIYKIKNLETSEILTFNGATELKEFIRNFKKEKGIGRTIPPSFNLLTIGRCNTYFQLVEKYFPNRN